MNESRSKSGLYSDMNAWLHQSYNQSSLNNNSMLQEDLERLKEEDGERKSPRIDPGKEVREAQSDC